MFVGHFAIAFLLWRLFPQVPLPVVLIAVSFPDLLWSSLVPAGVEKVRLNPDSPLQKFIVFEKFPYSHSLVLGNVWSLIVGLLVAGFLNNPLVVPVFVAGSASHWMLDTIVHLKDLPILGFDGDRKVGAGLWRRGPLAFVVEYAFYAIVTLFALSGVSLLYALILQRLRQSRANRIRIIHIDSLANHLTKSSPLGDRCPNIIHVVECCLKRMRAIVINISALKKKEGEEAHSSTSFFIVLC